MAAAGENLVSSNRRVGNNERPDRRSHAVLLAGYRGFSFFGFTVHPTKKALQRCEIFSLVNCVA